MASPTTLLAYHKGLEATLTRNKSDTEKRLQDLQQVDLTAARKASDDLIAKSLELTKTVADLQAGIPNAPTKSDQDALTQKLEKARIDLRSANAAQLNAQNRIASLTAQQTIHAAAINALTTAIAAAKAAQVSAAQREHRIQEATDSFAREPLNTLAADVTAALAGVTAAETRIQQDVPVDLLERAQDRRKGALQALEDVKSATVAAEKFSADKLQLDSARADAALFAFSSQAFSRLEASRVALAMLTNADPLTAEEKTLLADTSLVTAATTAMTAEKARDDAAATLSAKQALVDDARLQALKADIDVDPSTVTAVSDAEKDRKDADDALTAAVNDYTPAMQADLHRWEAAIPEAYWDLLHQLEEAKATLNELQTTTLASLTGAIADAEKAWADSLYTSNKNARTAARIDAEVKLRGAAQDFENNANRQRRLIALRGDL